MADQYRKVRASKLCLKSQTGSSSGHKKRRKKRKLGGDVSAAARENLRHGKWWPVNGLEEIRGRVVLETVHDGRYIMALDTGGFTVGPIRSEDEGPEATEIFSVVKISETQLAMKSGFGKYVSVTSAGELIGRAEAVGQREIWEPIFQDGMVAFQSVNQRYLVASKDGDLVVASISVVPEAKFRMRCVGTQEKKKKDSEEEDEEFKQDARSFEVGYVKRFQSFQDRKLKLPSEDNLSLHQAKDSGRLHEFMLDRRSKMKSDRYCKL